MKKVEEKEIALERKNRELEERKRLIEEELKKLSSPEENEDVEFHHE
jgi:chromosome condensin MukBEF ATPase and DNA-binding subunit MukB